MGYFPATIPPRTAKKLFVRDSLTAETASAIRDMELLMERCAMSPFIKEKKDYLVGIFDTAGRIVACHISGRQQWNCELPVPG